MSQNPLPYYHLPIQNNQYPYKNAHISKIFNIDITTTVQKQPKVFYTILEIYNNIQSNLLIQITSIQNVSYQLFKLHYQYVDTPLHLYIRRFFHSNIRIKIEKFCIELRDLANKFVVKGVNVMDAISVANIGVKMEQMYRQSFSSQQNKNEILMPTFKIYIDLNKCQLIGNSSNMARIIIETDKMIYNKINTEINEMIRKIEKEEHILSMKIFRKNQISSNNSNNNHDNNKQNCNDVAVDFDCGKIGKFAFVKKDVQVQGEREEDVRLDFSENLRKRKRVRISQSKKEITKCEEDKQKQQGDTVDSKSQKVILVKTSQMTEMPSQNLSAQVNDIIERSKKTLHNFKQLIKKQP